jgi:hypothetical protein
MPRNGDDVSPRVREIRLDKFGEDGIATLSQAMKIPVRTWENFEKGVMIPTTIILQFIELTGVEPHWLLTGKGARYRVRSGSANRRTLP